MTGDRLVAGIGFRRDTPSEAIAALIRRALAEAGPGDRLIAIATAADRAAEPAIREAASAFGLVPVAVEADALERVDTGVPTRSARIERLRGVGSLAEAAALAIAGDTGRLVVPRIDDGRATCALAIIGRDHEVRTGRVLPPPDAGYRFQISRVPRRGSLLPGGEGQDEGRELSGEVTPLTPALSPWEREPHSASRDPFGTVAPQSVNLLAEAGEGRAPLSPTERL